MACINSTVLVGHLTRDAEIKYFNNGNAIVKFSLAQNRRKKQGDDWVDEAMFFDVSFGGKGAEALHKYLTKGKQIGVQGELRQDRWEQDGQARSKTFVAAFEIQLLGGDRPANTSGPSQEQHHAGSGQSDNRFEDDIPFN
jgi:single-strand DNA-binding protein